MAIRIEITKKDNIEGDRIKKAIKDIGIKVKNVFTKDVYLIFGNLTEKEIRIIAEEILVDKVWEDYTIEEDKGPEEGWIEIAYNPGVLDPVAKSTENIIKEVGMDIKAVKRIKKYKIEGENIEQVKQRILYNKLIQHQVVKKEGLAVPPKYNFKPIYVPIFNTDLITISKQMSLFLNEEEMVKIRDYFKEINRNPTDVELETFGILWSEHCSHKTFKGEIQNSEFRIQNLLKSTIMKVTEELNKPWVISAFSDNAGIIEFDEDYAVCFKVETHNHPSALEPYGGAATGIGGVIRDILGCGKGAKPIANTDTFLFGNLDMAYEGLPEGVLHPKRIMKGVVNGVADYGNRMGIPTVNGGVFFNEGYTANPIIYCGCVGIIPKKLCKKKVEIGDLVVLIGGRTGRDGIHGATFASGEMTGETHTQFGSAVQIGDPITEKRMMDALLQARELYNSVTDCGAGGISTAISELAKDIGVIVELEKVPLKYEGLSYREIWISESQERMVLSVPEENIKKIKEIFFNEGVDATVIGEFIKGKKIIVKYRNNTVVELNTEFVLEGMPTRKLKVKRPRQRSGCPESKVNEVGAGFSLRNIEQNPLSVLKTLLSAPNIASKEWVVRQYDHEVQGGSVIKPLLGDAAVVRPLLQISNLKSQISNRKGIVIGSGISRLKDPYWMAVSAVDEAIRNVVAVGGDPDRIALLDNFSWGSPEDPEKMHDLVMASKGLYDTAKVYETPFISGKDSLYNEFKTENRTLSVPPTLLISAIGLIPDVEKAVSYSLKSKGNSIYMVGETYTKNRLPTTKDRKIFFSLHRAINEGIISACHDISEGGIGVGIAEMCITCLPTGKNGNLGARINLDNIPSSTPQFCGVDLLFLESDTRFLVEVKDETRFKEIMEGIPIGRIGEVTEEPILDIENMFKVSIKEVRYIYENSLKKLIE